MFGLTFEKLLLVGLIAAVILGPQRLPVVVARVSGLRRTVDAARVRAADEIGIPADAPQWRALDPRQYDPRRIIAEALAAPPRPASAPPGPASVPAAPAPVERAPVAPDPAASAPVAPAPVEALDPDAADTTADPAVTPVNPPMRRIRVGTSAHPRWIEVPVDAPTVGDTAVPAADDATERVPVTA
ncbi:hypothetical protein SAMN04487848_1760 [Microbacterium sp. ru370.1]|uniref:Sec-independent protein translocase subunit TatA/TatB n=1 Tax=unclassified Microbacterium TaxID=2609290 RepID=UPI00087E2082|nr:MULTISPECIES: hypothetical protein [unclassified Microbacterium]SDO62451.1 hypothetical protein SAMN04487848_1760 [Microbacterium sp. ru370.1]SIT86602.1 hypothetical protein SAMN05880579_1758 [Microbacterium sp. RU1D]